MEWAYRSDPALSTPLAQSDTAGGVTIQRLKVKEACVRRFWPVPIWMHLTLTILVTAACFFGGVFGGIALFEVWSHTLGAAGDSPDACACAAFFFGGAVVGLATGQLLMICCVPARCPKCGGRTYYRGGRPITYHCRDCRHVHVTSLSDSKGGWG
jgi:hypothetical protein